MPMEFFNLRYNCNDPIPIIYYNSIHSSDFKLTSQYIIIQCDEVVLCLSPIKHLGQHPI